MAQDRLPPLTRSQIPSQDQEAFDKLQSGASKLFGDPSTSPFIFARPSDGALVGPFPLFLAAPEAGEHVMNLFGKIATVPGLPPDAKEVAILTVGAQFDSAYELYAHTNVAVKKVGMEKATVEAIARGERPEGMNEGCQVAFDVAKYLVSQPGKLSDQLWARSVSVLGKEGTVALVHYVGAYAYTCVVLNAIDAPVPKESD